MTKRLPNALQFCHQLLKAAVSPNDSVIDGTIGNGHDTLFLAKLVGKSGQVYGFDIQKQALQNTTDRLLRHKIDLKNIQLYQRSHANINQVLPESQQITAAIFNLGYLPGGDKAIVTKSEATTAALTACLDHLAVNGLVIVVVYYGHPGGQTEKEAVLHFCQTLPQEKYGVLNYQFINQMHEPPFLLAIQKIK